MADGTGIEWTQATWNPVRGCQRVSEGCRNCYAEIVAKRFSGPGLAYEGLVDHNGRWNGVIRPVPEHLEDPIRWKRPRKIFVNSMSDLFHPNLADVHINNVWSVMEKARHHTYQILTKHPDRMLAWVTEFKRWFDYAAGPGVFEQRFAHVQLGVSVETQAAADDRIPFLIHTPATVRFISAEPLLSSVDLTNIPYASIGGAMHRMDALRGYGGWSTPRWEHRIHWVIVGGESGHGARPMHPAWARSLRDQCAAAGTAFFFKQHGEWLHRGTTEKKWPSGVVTVEDDYERIGKRAAGRLLDGREHSEFPEVGRG